MSRWWRIGGAEVDGEGKWSLNVREVVVYIPTDVDFTLPSTNTTKASQL